MSTITIKSGKINSDLFLSYSFEEKKAESTDTVNKKSDLPIHDDCKKAFINLIPHLILLCEQVNVNDTIIDAIENGISDPDDENSIFKDYRVNEFKISGSSSSEGVVICGTRFLSTGKSLNLVTPFLRWDSEDYKYINELAESIENTKEEVFQYYQGKHAPLPKQEKFDFDDDFDEPIDSLKVIGNNLSKKLKKEGISVEFKETEHA